MKFTDSSCVKKEVKLSTKIPQIGSEVIIKNKFFKINEICFFNFGFLPKYPKSIYLKIKVEKTNDMISGTPIYDRNEKLIGITSFCDDENIYCLPISFGKP